MATTNAVGTATCRHCNQQIRLVNHQLGPKWMHHAPGHADVEYEFCLVTRAEPAPHIPAQREGQS